MASRARVAALLAGVLGSGLLFASTWPLDAMVPRGQLGPGFWPRLVLIGLAVACLLKLREERRAGPGVAAASGMLPRVSAARLALGMACILGYVIAAPRLGFALATAAFIAAFMVVAGARRVPGIAATALARHGDPALHVHQARVPAVSEGRRPLRARHPGPLPRPRHLLIPA